MTPGVLGCVVGLLAACLLPATAYASQTVPPLASQNPLASVEALMAEAEGSLRAGEYQIAESKYRTAIAEGWLIIGALEAADGRLAESRDAFRRASTLTVDARAALRALALAHLRLGESDRAIDIFAGLARREPRNVPLRQLLAQALVAAGRPAEAVQELEEAHGAAPDDLELTFLLASGYLRLKKLNAAEPLFAQIAKARPMAHTHVLIGRTYRDAGEYARARRELELALAMDPRVPRAHYYLGTIDIMSEGITRLEPAIAEFGRELERSPGDPAASLGLGLTLVHARRHAEALPHLQLAAASEPLEGNARYYLGRCLLGLDRPADAVAALQRSLDLSQRSAGAVERKNIHYQLGLALRALGQTDAAAAHFAEADQAWEGRLTGDRERLSRYLADVPEPQTGATVAAAVDSSLPFADVPAAARADLATRCRRMLVGGYFNVGVLHAQSGRFVRAAEFLREAATLDPGFPRVQYSLGVANFNATLFENAVTPLELALAQTPDDADVRRMLALSLLNTDAYARAADMLRDDPLRASDPALQYAYAVALARSGRPSDAEATFARLLTEHGDRADLHVVLGQAHAQQGDMESAVRELQRALAIEPTVAEANRTLGNIYFRQGKLAEAITALRGELSSHPGDLKARHTLAAALELDGQFAEALPLLRSILALQPQHADARYLLGKILLSQGSVAEATEHLEIAVRLAPEDAGIHYQLGQAYQKSGRVDLAEEQFESFRRIKDRRRGKTQ